MFKVKMDSIVDFDSIKRVFRAYMDNIDYRVATFAYVISDGCRHEPMTFSHWDLADGFVRQDDLSLVNQHGKIAKRLAKFASGKFCFDVIKAYPDAWSRAVNDGLSEHFGIRTVNVELINQFDGRVTVYESNTCYWNPDYYAMWRVGIDQCPNAGLVHFTNDNGTAIGRLWYELTQVDNDPVLVLWNSYGKGMTGGFMYEAARQAAIAKGWITEDHFKFDLCDYDYVGFDGYLNGDLYVFALSEPDRVYTNIEPGEDGRACDRCGGHMPADNVYFLESADMILCADCYYELDTCAVCQEPYLDHDLQDAVAHDGRTIQVCCSCAWDLADCDQCGMPCVDAQDIDGEDICASCAMDAEPCDRCGDLSLDLCIVGNGQHGIANLCNLCFHDAPTDNDGWYLFTVANGLIMWDANDG